MEESDPPKNTGGEEPAEEFPDVVDGVGQPLIDEADEVESSTALPYPVVAIGGSAGGVEAYIELLGALAPDTGMTFVVIPHLAAEQKSHLVEILARQTMMPVLEIAAGIRPEPNHVYVLPPNQHAVLRGGVFRIETRPVEAPLRTIDIFFRALAADQKNRAVGVVLSGMDSDGALGLKSIKGEGGITMVQSLESARFSEMPRVSISVEHVDRILPPAQIAAELAELARHFFNPALRPLEEGIPQPGDEQHFARILNLMRGVSGVDFRLYKPSTIRRRIARRMLLHRVQTLAEYAGFLQGNQKEVRELQEDALINVTRFFRDPPIFESIQNTVLPRIFQDREPDRQVRIWVAGCSTGEEAYSIAICLVEYLTGQSLEPPIQIFGTDASDYNIQKARAGIFPESIAGDVSPERLRRFFVKIDKGYQVSKRVRDLCIFARQNICHDPPFSKMDLISCRNVLIYLGQELQRQILPMFHYALRFNGFLLLGTSETIREYTDLFQPLDRKAKIFSRIGAASMPASVTTDSRMFVTGLPAPAVQPSISENWGGVELQRAADRIVLARYGPPGVVINEKLEILQSRGHTSPYLEMPQGAVSLQLPRMLRGAIASQVTHAVLRAVEHDTPVRVEGLRLPDEGIEREITLEVLPIHTVAPRARSFLVLFKPALQLDTAQAEAGDPGTPALEGGERDHMIDRLRQDLTYTKLYLQTLLEERDARNQELVSANEEIQSANEEMQSTNEELETIKEELQSSNEELQTVNDELQQRNAVLTQTSNDLSGLLNSVNLPVLMLGQGLHIRHFTPPTQRLMNLRPTDIGRPITDIRLNLEIVDVEQTFTEVLDTLAPKEMQVQDREGHWYLMRIRPYRTTDNKIEGLVVVLLDVDQLQRSQQEIRRARDFARSVIESVPLPLAVIDTDLRIRTVNDAFRDFAGSRNEELEMRSFPDLAAAAWGLDEALRRKLEDLRSGVDPNRHFELEHRLANYPHRVFSIHGRLLPPDEETFLLITLQDLSAQRDAERLLDAERQRLSAEVDNTARELVRTQDELRALTSSLFTSQENERRRVARELHDDICQKLAALQIDTEQVEGRIARQPHSAELESIRSGIEILAEDVRRISHTLHPSVIDDLGLAAALRALVEDFRDREEMIVTLTATDLPQDIPNNVVTGLYRITQEALRNIAKHAGRTHVKVTLKAEPGGLRLQIQDYGEGFDVKTHPRGLGIVSMEERARMLQGTFLLKSQPGEGTRVTVQVPLADATAAN